MAHPFTEIQSVCVDHITREAVNNQFPAIAIVGDLEKKNKRLIYSGEFIRESIRIGTTGNFTYYNDYDNLPLNAAVNNRAAKFEMVSLYDAWTLANDPLRRASGDSERVNWIRSKSEGMAEDLKDNIETEVFSANADLGGSIVGLRTMLAAGTSDYGGIDSNDTGASNWSPAKRITTADLNLALSDITSVKHAIKKNGGDPDIAYTTYDVVNDIVANLIGSTFQRITIGADGRAEVLGETPIVAGILIKASARCPGTDADTGDNHMFVLSSKRLNWYVSPLANWVVSRVMFGENIVTQDIVGRQIRLACQLTTPARWHHGVLTTIKPNA